MLARLEFKNYRCLKDAHLDLEPLNVVVGPNGAGKSTLLDGIAFLAECFRTRPAGSAAGTWDTLRTVGTAPEETSVVVRAKTTEGTSFGALIRRSQRNQDERVWGELNERGEPDPQRAVGDDVLSMLRTYRVYRLVPSVIGLASPISGSLQLKENGADLAAVLDALRDKYPERFDALNEELGKWFPDFDRLVFHVPPRSSGSKALGVRVRVGGHHLLAENLSDGTRLALALLTLAWLPEPPRVIGIEEPDRGIHPRLLDRVHDALVRLASPEEFGEKRPPVQVIATTHSPYLLDLFKDHPEHVVIAEKTGLEARFERLTNRRDLQNVLSRGLALGEIWYSGILGGVP